MTPINRKTKYFQIIFVLFVFLSFQNITLADDTIPTQIPELDEQVDATLDPKFPEPNDPVTITLDAFGIDLNNANISWTSGGKTLLEGKGETVLKTTAGKAGQTMNINVTIDAPNSKQITKTITISPQSVDIIWEAKTYTPPFYKGKAMFSPEENVKLVAFPNQISPKNAIYKWTQDGEVLSNKSGFGKNSLTFKGNIFASKTDFGVTVTDGGDSTAQNFLSIAPTDPEVYLYENNPLYGILFNKEISTLFDLGTAQEGSISVYPFFYGVTSRDNKNLEYKWTINNNPIDVPPFQNDMTFRNTDNISGKSAVSVEVRNIDNDLEDIQKATLINFKQLDNSGFSF